MNNAGLSHPSSLFIQKNPKIHAVCLVHLVCFVYQVDLVHLLVSFSQTNQTNEKNEKNEKNLTE
jgi:hypothetical protein